MKLSRFIKYLEKIQSSYGDIPVSGNIINSDNCYLSSLCVDTTEEEPQLLIEVESSADIPVFNCYEYPSYKEINLEN